MTEWYLDRIERLNPVLNAIIMVAPRALDWARASDRVRAAGGGRGPMEGIPIQLKDTIGAGSVGPTTAGSLALAGFTPPDAFLMAIDTVPAGFVRELPVGISFLGVRWSEPRLLGLAYAFERGTCFRRSPMFLPTLPMNDRHDEVTAPV